MSIFSGVTKHNYTYVPPCPCCGSPKTGRFVKQKTFNKDNRYYMEETLKNGELIMLVPDVGVDNAFCYDCEYTWHARIQNVWLTTNEIAQERIARGTNDLYDAYTHPYEEKKESLLDRFPIKNYFGKR